MESIIDDIDVDKPLPSVIVIKCAENHLYRNGLSLFSFRSQIKKVLIIHFLFHSLFVSKYLSQ